MKLRINGKVVCEMASVSRLGLTAVEFLMPADWSRVPPGRAEVVDDAGNARPVKLSARRVGFREIWVAATYLPQEMGAGAT